MRSGILTLPSLLVAVALLSNGLLAHADDPKAPAIPDGYKKVKLSNGTYILVQKDGDPFAHVRKSNSDKYDPSRVFSTTFPMATKSFSPSDANPSGKTSALDSQSTYVTKSYAGIGQMEHGTSDLNTKFATTTSADGSRTSGLDKSYPTSGASIGRTTFATSASTDQNHTAVLTSRDPTKVYASPLSSKSYEGPEKDIIKKELTKMNEGLIEMKDLPDRPLSIDEVRALINHGVKPETSRAPDESSKPLNDPNYKAEPIRDLPPPVSGDDDKNSPVPPPGTMAQPPPENNEPLPQH